VPLDQKGTGAGEMPFLDHLEELRWRIVKSVATLGVTFSTAFAVVWFNFDPIMKVLIEPIRPMLTGGRLVYTHPIGPMTIVMQVAGVLGIVVASPVIGYQVWSFLSPALHERERKTIVPVLGFAAILFLVGVALAVLVVIPMIVTMIGQLSSDALQSMITAEAYFGFLIFMSVAFGALFELPVLILILTALGLVTPQALGRVRKHALVISLIACMMIIPGDAVTATLAMWIPVYGLYEFSIWVSWFVHRARLKREAEAESIEAGAAV
jgi:sec-independent protein translocase protein TatC